jgi:hypothetical protein
MSCTANTLRQTEFIQWPHSWSLSLQRPHSLLSSSMILPMQEKLHILLPKLHINAVDILPNPATIEYRTPILFLVRAIACLPASKKGHPPCPAHPLLPPLQPQRSQAQVSAHAASRPPIPNCFFLFFRGTMAPVLWGLQSPFFGDYSPRSVGGNSPLGGFQPEPPLFGEAISIAGGARLARSRVGVISRRLDLDQI